MKYSRKGTAGDAAEAPERTAAGKSARSAQAWNRLIDVHAHRQLVAFRADIRNIKHQILSQLALYAEAPLIDVGRFEVRINARCDDRWIAGESVCQAGPRR